MKKLQKSQKIFLDLVVENLETNLVWIICETKNVYSVSVKAGDRMISHICLKAAI